MNAVDAMARGIAARAMTGMAATLRLAQLKALRFGSIPDIPGDQPMIGLFESSAVAQGVTIANDDPRITYAHAAFAPDFGGYPYDFARVAAWITTPDPAIRAASNGAIRFHTDAPLFEVELGDFHGPGDYLVLIDGAPMARSAIRIVNAGSISKYLRVDFGADVQTIRPQVAVSAGGSGYAVGDLITVAGGSGRAVTLRLLQVDAAGAIVTLQVADHGAYTALPAGPVATSGGTGRDAAVTLTDSGRSGHTSRRMRRIEILGANARFIRLVVPPLSTVRAWPVSGPRLFGMLDSYGDTYQDGPGGAYLWRVGRRLGIEDVWSNGQGGTGFLATNVGNSCTFRQRLGDIAANLPESAGTPVLLLTHGSINDAAAASADALQAEVQAYHAQAFATLPDAGIVQIGLLRASGATPSDAYDAAVKAGFAAAQAIHDPGGRRSAFIETRGGAFDIFTTGGRAGATNGAGNTDFYDASDGAHPTQDGHDFLGDVIAGEVLAAIGRRSPPG